MLHCQQNQEQRRKITKLNKKWNLKENEWQAEKVADRNMALEIRSSQDHKNYQQ